MDAGWAGVICTVAGASIWLVTLITDSRIMKQRIKDLEHENERLRDYAKNSKP